VLHFGAAVALFQKQPPEVFRISGHGDHRCPFPQPSPEASGGLHCDLCGSVAAVGHLPMPKAMAVMGMANGRLAMGFLLWLNQCHVMFLVMTYKKLWKDPPCY